MTDARAGKCYALLRQFHARSLQGQQQNIEVAVLMMMAVDDDKQIGQCPYCRRVTTSRVCD